MACHLCEKLKIKTKSINNNIMAEQNDMVTITNGSQTRKVARSYYETYCTKTWKLAEEPTPTEQEAPEAETETAETETETDPKPKKKK